jgi:glutamyl-Q tRNA(Asp) synthetase
VEDVDLTREVAGAAQDQLRTLAAFGLQHDGEIAYQSRRSGLYQAALDQLLGRGLAFECHCSRSELAAVGGIHRHCVATQPRPDPAMRLRAPADCEIAFIDGVHGVIHQRVDLEVGDFVLRRSDGLWAYQLAVVVDDAAQGITDVVRGSDLLESTPRQILLQRALGLPTPNYAHLPLLLDTDGHKLSKSSAALPVDTRNPLVTLTRLWACLGQVALPPSATTSVAEFLHTATACFDLNAVPRQSITVSAAMHNTISTPCA